MEVKYYIIFISALIPMVLGALWYSPMLFENAWLKQARMTKEDINKGNLFLILGLAYFFCVMLSGSMLSFTIHQMAAINLFATQPEFADPNSDMSQFVKAFMANYGDLHRSFGHGAAHGFVAGLFIATPLIGIVALYERKSWKYVAIHAGFWIICLMLMCGIISQFA